MDLQHELAAIDAVLEDLRRSRNSYYFNTVSQIGGRLKSFLTARGISIRQMITENLGEAEVINGSGVEASTRDLYKNALRAILSHLCEKGVTALAYDKCMIPAVDMDAHRLPRGLLGFPEALLGIYPAWLVPERFQRGIEHNAAVPEKIRTEFKSFAESVKHEINERSLHCYWGNLRVLVTGLGLQSLKELQGEEGTKRLAKFIEEKGYTKKTSTVNHWRKMLRHVVGGNNPFDRKGEFGDYLLKLPKHKPKTVIKEGAAFRKNGKHHRVIGGVIMEERMTIQALKYLLAKPIESTDFREHQEDLCARFLAVIKDRPVEFWARNHNSWKLIPTTDYDEESRLFAGDGYIINNFRESIRKNRTDKPFPRWLSDRCGRLWTLRREHFAERGDTDLRESQAMGLLQAGPALWVDPRTGYRASQGQVLEWVRKALARAGMKDYIVEHITARWFRRGIITAEYYNAALFESVCATSGHDPRVGRRDYLGMEMPAMVALEREQYWKPMGIAGNVTSGKTAPLHQQTSRIVVAKAPRDIEVVSAPNRLTGLEAAKQLGISVATLHRWGMAGILTQYDAGRQALYSTEEVADLRGHYVPIVKAARISGKSESYLRRLCRQGRISGMKRIGRKTYLLPIAVVVRLDE